MSEAFLAAVRFRARWYLVQRARAGLTRSERVLDTCAFTHLATRRKSRLKSLAHTVVLSSLLGQDMPLADLVDREMPVAFFLALPSAMPWYLNAFCEVRLYFSAENWMRPLSLFTRKELLERVSIQSMSALTVPDIV